MTVRRDRFRWGGVMAMLLLQVTELLLLYLVRHSSALSVMPLEFCLGLLCQASEKKSERKKIERERVLLPSVATVPRFS